MLTKEQNDRLTQTNKGTPCGELFRRYWLPIAPAGELTADRPKKRVRLLGEDLVLFRDGSGESSVGHDQLKMLNQSFIAAVNLVLRR